MATARSDGWENVPVLLGHDLTWRDVHRAAARIFREAGIPSRLHDDAEGEAFLAAVKASKRFDDTKGTTLATFINTRMKGAILNWRAKNVPRRMQESDTTTMETVFMKNGLMVEVPCARVVSSTARHAAPAWISVPVHRPSFDHADDVVAAVDFDNVLSRLSIDERSVVQAFIACDSSKAEAARVLNMHPKVYSRELDRLAERVRHLVAA